MQTIPKVIHVLSIVKLLNSYQGTEIFWKCWIFKILYMCKCYKCPCSIFLNIISLTIRNQQCRCVSCEHILRYSQEQVKCLVGSWPAIKLRDLSGLICLQLRIKMVQHKALATLNAHKQYLILLHFLPFSTFWLWCITIY